MTFIPKKPLYPGQNAIYRALTLDSCLQGKKQTIITKLSLVIMYLYLFLLVFPQAAMSYDKSIARVYAESSASDANSVKNLSIKNQACSQNLDVSRLVSISAELSDWLKKHSAAIEFVSQKVTLATLVNVNKLGIDFGKSGLYRLLMGHIVPLEVAIAEKPISIYAQVLQQEILPLFRPDFNFTNPVQLARTTINNVSLILISGGEPITIHADSRYQVPEIIAKSGTNAIAAVDGTFFSLKYLKSNTMIGPVMSQVTNKFVPGNNSENKKLAGRPLVLISPQKASYIPFEPDKHNTLPGIQAEMPDVTDAFVAGAWLVKDGKNLPRESYKTLYGADVARHRAFWGISKEGVPTIGVSTNSVDSARLGIVLIKAGIQDAVMLDSGASTSLAFQGQSLVGYTPRPVPHAIALLPSDSKLKASCAIPRIASD